MSLEFYEENNSQQLLKSRTILGEPKVPGMTGVIMRLGVKNEKTAFQLLTASALFFFLASIIILTIYLPDFREDKTGRVFNNYDTPTNATK